MLQVYNLGTPTYSATASSNTGVKIVADKLHELGLCDEYAESMLTYKNASYAVGKIEITFPDKTSIPLYLFMYSSNEKILFVDVEKHFIVCAPSLSVIEYTGGTGDYFCETIHGIVSEDLFGQVKAMLITSTLYVTYYNTFNLPARKFFNSSSDSFVLTQLAIFNPYGTSQFTDVFYPNNVYVCYDHFYPTGTKVEDNKGFKYISLSPFIFYRYE